MEYEVWHVDTDELVGRIELATPIPEEVGAPVTVKVKGRIEHKRLGAFNAIQMKVCRMVGSKEKCPECEEGCPSCKGRGYLTSKYFALETNLPKPLLPKLEGFTPHIRVPSLWEIFNTNRTRLH